MSTRTTTLALEVVSEVADAVSGLEAVDTAASGAATAVDKVNAAAADTASKLDGVSSSADGLDSTAGAATGALGALASGFELLGAEDAAVALQNAGLATDFLSGVGQSATLVMQAQGAATKALTGAQRALNVVMRANPLGLLLVAGLAVAGLLTLLYNKSETFRGIVQAAGRAGKAAMDAVVTGVRAVVSWVGDRIPGAFSWLLNKASAAVRPATDALDAARDGAKLVWEWVGKIPAKFGELKDKADLIAAPLLAPFTALREAIEWVLDKLANIKIPDWVPGFSSNSRTTAPGDYADDPVPDMFQSPLGRMRADTRPQVNIVVQGAVDPYAVAQQITGLLSRYDLAVS